MSAKSAAQSLEKTDFLAQIRKKTNINDDKSAALKVSSEAIQ